jgi:fatty-acyl-CoA synthase
MHFADIFEAIADAIPDQDALVCGNSRRSWQAFDDRAARLSQAFLDAGLKPNAKIGFYLYNGNEYIEAYYATIKSRGVAVNINYRYVEDELKYLLEYSDTEILIFHSSLGERVGNVTGGMTQIKQLIEVADDDSHLEGAVRYEELIAAKPPAARITRQHDDLFMNFTGGTTGMPKGVVYHIGEVTDFYIGNLAGFFGFDVALKTVADVANLAKSLAARSPGPASLPACPLMHTAGLMNGLLTQLVCGAKIVTLADRSFNATAMLEAIEKERITYTVIVGDAFCLPIVQALDDAKAAGRSYDLSSLSFVMSSGVVWSPELKTRLLEYIDATLMDAMGATEGGMGLSVTNRKTPPGSTGKFNKMPSTKVFTEEGREIEPGSGEVGYIAAGGSFVPVAYYKDPEKSAKTFRLIDGKRYAFIGDMGTIEADGTLTVMGRGSGCINTAGEKVFPEEVETVLREHPQIDDCIVVGMPHERFGQCVAAVVATHSSQSNLQEAEVLTFCKEKLAGYKCPRIISIQPSIERGPNGKAILPWARKLLEEIQQQDQQQPA